MTPMRGDTGLPGSKLWHNKCGVVSSGYIECKSCVVIEVSPEISKEDQNHRGNMWQVKM